MTPEQWLLVLLGPWLIAAALVAIVAPQIPNFFGVRRPESLTTRVRIIRPAPAWRLA